MNLDFRTCIIAKHKLTLVKAFDTFEKTDGEKDVLLCQMKGQRVILRIGETRSEGFAESGYSGKYLFIPKILSIQQEGEIRYEIEEYVDAPKIFELNFYHQAKGMIKAELVSLLIDAFWEFQTIGKSWKLELKPSKIDKHFEKTRLLMKDQDRVMSVIEKYRSFWNGAFPSKWKFSLDNLLLTNDNRIAFIDNSNTGLRFFGYDLGWIIWPLWIEMDIANWKNVDTHFSYLQSFLKTFVDNKPQSLEVYEDLKVSFWLTVLERIVGALFDLENDTRHLKNHELNKTGNQQKRQALADFLNKLSVLVMKEIP